MDSLKLEILTKLSDSISKWLDVLPWYVSDLILRYQKFIYSISWIWLIVTFIIFVFCLLKIIKYIDSYDSDLVPFLGTVLLIDLGILFVCVYYLIQAYYVPEALLLGL